MKSNKLKRIAEYAAREKSISTDIEKFVLNLSRHDLKVFLAYFRNELQKNTVNITSASTLTNESLNDIKRIFKDMKIHTNIDTTLGAGIKVEQADNIIDFTFKKYINDTIELLK